MRGIAVSRRVLVGGGDWRAGQVCGQPGVADASGDVVGSGTEGALVGQLRLRVLAELLVTIALETDVRAEPIRARSETDFGALQEGQRLRVVAARDIGAAEVEISERI